MFGATDFVVTLRFVCRGPAPRLLVLSLLSFLLSTATASAQYCTPDQCDECNLCQCSQCCCHELPELWLINTRCAPRCCNLDCGFDRLIYKRYDRKCCRWVRESRESFLAQEGSKPTLFYAHGNSLNHKNAMKSCWQIYCKMRCCPGPKRLVFWSWPAERVYKTEGLRVREMIKKNLRIKYVYAEYQGYYLAKLVNQMSLSQRVMMSGHSYGGITASAAMHYLGGGCLRGLVLDGGAPVERPNLRAAVISGAFDHDMLNPGNRYGQTFIAAEKVYVTRNIKDRTLKKWPKTSWRCKRAIGVCGVNANCLGVHRSKLCQQTMTDDVGTSHYLTPHLKSVKFVSALCCLSFPQCHSCPVAQADVPTAQPEVAPQVVTDEQLEAESEFIFDEDDFDFTSYDYRDEIRDLTQLAADEFSPFDYDDVTGADVFAPGERYDEHSLDALVAASPSYQEPVLRGPLLTQSVTKQPAPAAQQVVQAPQPQQASDEQPTPQPQLAGATTQFNLLYQIGLCLALALTGHCYVFISKRIASS